MKIKLSKYGKAQLYAAGYVGLGTIFICSGYPSDPIFLGEDLTTIGIVLTLPVNLPSFIYRYFESGNLHIVLIIQSVILLFCMLITHFFYNFYDRNYRIRNKQPHSEFSGVYHTGYTYYKGELFTGTERLCYDSGKIKTTTEFEDGIKDGMMTGWFENGVKCIEMPFDKGRVCGVVREWNSNGQLRIEKEMRDDKIIWIKEWDENGSPQKNSCFF